MDGQNMGPSEGCLLTLVGFGLVGILACAYWLYQLTTWAWHHVHIS